MSRQIWGAANLPRRPNLNAQRLLPAAIGSPFSSRNPEHACSHRNPCEGNTQKINLISSGTKSAFVIKPPTNNNAYGPPPHVSSCQNQSAFTGRVSNTETIRVYRNWKYGHGKVGKSTQKFLGAKSPSFGSKVVPIPTKQAWSLSCVAESL